IQGNTYVSGIPGRPANQFTIAAVTVGATTTTFQLVGTSTAAAGTATGGTFSVVTDLVAAPGGPVSVDGTPTGATAFDTHQDGNPDLVTADQTGQDFSLLLGNGDATFQVAGNTALTTSSDRAPTDFVAVGDLNGDGLNDIVIVNNNSSTNNTKVTI